MKVILNVDAITQPLTGLGHYAFQLASGLPNHANIEDVKLYSSHRWIKDAESTLSANQNLVRLRNNVPFKTMALKLYTWQKNFLFKHKSKRFAQDYVLHSPNFLLMPYAGKSVTTIHDLSFLRYPETHPIERIKLLEMQLPKSLARADAIITDSEFIKSEVHEALGIAESKIHVVALGVSRQFKPYTAKESAFTMKKHKLATCKYLLSVATLEPRKNLSGLLDAYLMLPKKIRKEYKLVIVGARGWLSEKLMQRIKNLVSKEEIIALGYVSDSELHHLYARAHGFVFPSFYEGFGLPILEAMASGVPVLTSNTSSLPEVAAGCALLTDAWDSKDIAQGIVKLIEDEKWREESIAKGFHMAEKYSWEKCIENTVKVYEQVKSL